MPLAINSHTVKNYLDIATHMTRKGDARNVHKLNNIRQKLLCYLETPHDRTEAIAETAIKDLRIIIRKI